MFHVIYIPGLNDTNRLQKNLIQLLAWYWKRYNICGHVVFPAWENGESFEQKLTIILACIDSLHKKGYVVSLIGQSAGGSAALNAFTLRRKIVHKCINITGRVREGKGLYPSLAWAARGSKAFKESVVLFERKNERLLKAEDRKRILTIRPFIDEVVPAETVGIHGARSVVAPFAEHILGGALIDIFYAKVIADFLSDS